jgi:nucleoside phosphorylase
MHPERASQIDVIVNIATVHSAVHGTVLLDLYLRTLEQQAPTEAVDLLLLCAKRVEFEALQVVLGRPLNEVPVQPDPSGRHIYFGSLDSQRAGRALTYALICLNRQGNALSSAVVSDILSRTPARLAALVGMAAGNPEKVRKLDVIPAEYVLYVSSGTRADDGDVAEPVPREMDGRTAEDVGAARPEHYGWTESFNEAIERARSLGLNVPQTLDTSKSPELKPGVILSVEQKIELTDIVGYMQRFSGDAKALDMESAGFAFACKNFPISWVVFRGVSDFGKEFDEEGRALPRDKTLQLAAAISAATAFVTWISTQSMLFTARTV